MLGQASEFAARIEETIRRSLPGPVVVRALRHPANGRTRISPVDPDDPLREVTLPLTGHGVQLARWSFVMFAESSQDGRRFRPGIEDFVQFLVQECGFDAEKSWRHSLEDGRELGRRFQVRTIARDYPAEVAEVLRQNGWVVTPPSGFDDWEATAALREF